MSDNWKLIYLMVNSSSASNNCPLHQRSSKRGTPLNLKSPKNSDIVDGMKKFMLQYHHILQILTILRWFWPFLSPVFKYRHERQFFVLYYKESYLTKCYKRHLFQFLYEYIFVQNFVIKCSKLVLKKKC